MQLTIEHLLVFVVVVLEQQPFVAFTRIVAFVTFISIVAFAAFVRVVEVIAFGRNLVAERTFVRGSQETLIEVAYQIVMAFESIVELVQIEGTFAGSLASIIAEVVVLLDQPELMLDYEFEPYYYIALGYQTLASIVKFKAMD